MDTDFFLSDKPHRLGEYATHPLVRPTAVSRMIPLIDVMLVLLVSFIVTAPLLTHAVKPDLPKGASHPNLPGPGILNSPSRPKARFTGMGKR